MDKDLATDHDDACLDAGWRCPGGQSGRNQNGTPPHAIPLHGPGVKMAHCIPRHGREDANFVSQVGCQHLMATGGLTPGSKMVQYSLLSQWIEY